MEKTRKRPPLKNSEETSAARINSNTLKEFQFPNMESTPSSSETLKNFTTSSIWTTEASDYFNVSYSYYSYLQSLNESASYVNASITTNSVGRKVSCQWEPAQHSLFQLSNICFLSAFVIPKNYKSGVFVFRVLLCLSFVISAVWAGVHFCALDWFIWSSGLAITNGIHVVVLTFKFLPPALSLELTELYIRVFKPLKVSKKHFKELTKEACLLRLVPGETYAVEEVTIADEKLSILLKGKLKVSCNDTFLHSISGYQFVDSPEFKANSVASGARFQVTITAEEDCLCLTWCRIKLDRILRHRPQVKFVLNNLIGKDITHKMYSLNEQLGQLCTNEALSRVAKEDHWRSSMNRSVSVDAVDTGTRGQVRSNAWKQTEKCRKSSTHSEYDSRFGQQAKWYPLIASQFPAEYPFTTIDESCGSQNDERAPMLAKNGDTATRQRTHVESPPKSSPDRATIQQMKQQRLKFVSPYSKLETIPLLNVANNQLLSSQSVALIPVIVPIVATAVNTVSTSTVSTTTIAPSTSSKPPSLKRQRGVKFDETQL